MADEFEIDIEQDELRTRIDESREALTQKIEQLEEKVTETVETATASVAEVTASVMETVQNATDSVSQTVDSVTNAVQGTVDTMRQSVEGTVDSVKGAFDLSRQVERHPLLMLAGAVAVGYFGAKLLQGESSGPGSKSPSVESNGAVKNQTRSFPEWEEQPFIADQRNSKNGFHSNGAPSDKSSEATTSMWTSQFGEALGPEIHKLQSLAIGVLLGTVRDVIVQAVPQPIHQPIADVINEFTEKLGGTCIRDPLLTPVSQPHPGTSVQQAPLNSNESVGRTAVSY